MSATTVAVLAAPAPGSPPAPRFLKPGWPLAVLYLGFPLWWALGLAQLIFFAMAAAMAVILYRQRPLRVPRGFALWLLFLVWMLAGVFLIRANAPGHRSGRRHSAGSAASRCGRAGTSRSPSRCCTSPTRPARCRRSGSSGCWAGCSWSRPASGCWPCWPRRWSSGRRWRWCFPKQLVSTNFVRTLVHPSLSSSSDFLGYVQPRPTAPFPYSNAWGNNLALYLPFFVLAWFGRDAGWRRKVGPVVLVAAIFPITFSLNRGLWISLALAAVYAAVRLAVNGRGRALQALVAAVLVGGLVFVSSPLYDTMLLRVETPHSNDRRAGTAETVVSVTAQGSPLVGYGTTRTMQGSFSSLAGGETDAVPPVRCATARDAGLHVAPGAHHRLRRHRACACRSSPCSSCAERGAPRRWT